MKAKRTLSEAKRSPLYDYIRFTEIKRLIHQLDQERQRNQLKTVAVLSELPGEGKTFLISAIALGFAVLLKKRVLIVDTTSQAKEGNLYLERIFGNVGGKSRKAAGASAFDDEDAQFVDLISPKNETGASTESADFQIGPFVDSYKEDYDLILFDTCAISRANKNNIDPVIIAKHAGAAIQVLSPLSVNMEVLGKIREGIRNWEINLAGTVFNRGVLR